MSYTRNGDLSAHAIRGGMADRRYCYNSNRTGSVSVSLTFNRRWQQYYIRVEDNNRNIIAVSSNLDRIGEARLKFKEVTEATRQAMYGNYLKHS